MAPHTEAAPVVQMRAITVRFPGVLALDNVDFALRAGEVHTLMGENGAGKSTLIKALTGVYQVDAGSITVSGQEQVFATTGDAQGAGISTVYQEVNLCPNLSVGENVMLGHEPRTSRRIDWKAAHAEAARHLGSLGLHLDTHSLLSSHSIAVQQLVAISRAMVLDARVLILDEPTSSLDREEVERLFVVVRGLRDEGVAILFVSHFLDQVYEIADRITVLRNGQLVGEYRAAELPRAELVSKMLGRAMTELEAISESADRVVDRTGAPTLRATGIARRGILEQTDLDVYPGEVVGVAGLLGSGRTELVRLIYGADRADHGQVEINGAPVKLSSPRHAVEQRIAFSSEDRRDEGIVAGLTVAENIILGVQAQRGWLRRVRRAEQDALVADSIASLGVRPADPEMMAGNLSGGNQQKVVLARWLATAPQLIILDEPTRGIDVGAKADIQRKVADLAREGLAVVFISSELEEVLRLAQRIVVMRDRRQIGRLNSSDTDIEGLINFMANEGQGSLT
jgi:monosaccharide-transporting ATPase